MSSLFWKVEKNLQLAIDNVENRLYNTNIRGRKNSTYHIAYVIFYDFSGDLIIE